MTKIKSLKAILIRSFILLTINVCCIMSLRKKLIWAVLAFLGGLLCFLVYNQYLGAGIIVIGIVLADSYFEVKK